ncbi:Acetyltransferase (GNAT) family protein [Asanoa hainanensis]|uniref:Acetyltransferase (GNAT) family protein n=1 Tax=Asanoa hainanensis TaxID=560556 RepID=A0A239MEI1_9ACTN|nr:GNAT family N-acetyltransferase [Asanoa hainanensis]SNT40910.1 Acetyltransferase (GNAT) family protein [Asanoa hainanensis]
MTELRFVSPADDPALEDWRLIHNVVVPPWPLSLPEVTERAGRNLLEVAYLDRVAVGNSTVRPPGDDGVATVIARVLPAHRGRGFGTLIHSRALAAARELGPAEIETLVLAANVDGLRFAEQQGYVEVERYEVHGAQEVRLRLR